MSFEYLLDRLLQFCCAEIVEKFIQNTSNYLTKLIFSIKANIFSS